MADEISTDALDSNRPAPGSQGLRQRLATVAPRTWFVAGAAWLLVVGLSAVYVATAERVYEASVDIVVTPLPVDEQRFEVGLLTESPDPTLEVQTAAGLIRRGAVAERASRALPSALDANALLDDVTVTPVGNSNLVEVTASQATPQRAADLANAFGRAAVGVQSTELRGRIDRALTQLQERAALAEGASLDEINDQIGWLDALREGGDPTLRLQTSAEPPASPVRPRPVLTLAVGVVGGWVLGAALAFVLGLTDTRLRREHQLRGLYNLPTLARIPRGRRGSGDAWLQWDELSGPSRSAYRRLRSILAAATRVRHSGRSVLITGVAPMADRAGVAVQLGSALALTGSNVILIATDWRQPILREIVRVHFEGEVERVARDQARLRARGLNSSQYGTRLRLLVAEASDTWSSAAFSAEGMDRLLDRLAEQADYVVVTTPPPTEAADTLPLTGLVESLVVVVRVGSPMRRVRELAEAFAVNGVRPAGFVLSGVGSQPGS